MAKTAPITTTQIRIVFKSVTNSFSGTGVPPVHRSTNFLFQPAHRPPTLCSGAAIPLREIGGEGGIRTPVPLTRKAVFKTAAIDHSATSPISPAGWPGRCASEGLHGVEGLNLQPT